MSLTATEGSLEGRPCWWWDPISYGAGGVWVLFVVHDPDPASPIVYLDRFGDLNRQAARRELLDGISGTYELTTWEAIEPVETWDYRSQHGGQQSLAVAG